MANITLHPHHNTIRIYADSRDDCSWLNIKTGNDTVTIFLDKDQLAQFRQDVQNAIDEWLEDQLEANLLLEDQLEDLDNPN